MQYVYYNTYWNYRVREIYNDFVARTYNHPKKFVDVYPVVNSTVKHLNLNRYPIEYINPPIVNVYANEAAFNAGVIETTLIENTHYSIDYELGILNFFSTYTPIVGKYIEIIGFHVRINLMQFVTILNASLRDLIKYFPTKALIEYTAAMAGLAPEDPQEIDRVNLTSLDFLDVNTCWADITAKTNIPFARRGEYIIFNDKQKEYTTDFGLNITQTQKQTVPFWIEGNLKPDQILRDPLNPDAVLNQTFRFSTVWYDALLLYLRIQMYMIRLEYNEDINVSTLKLNTVWIYGILRELKWELASKLGDQSIAKWFYPAGTRNTYNNTLSDTNI